ncbi:thioredoxin family protein [Pontiellaceae bacterium B1224]|nr:thioredoxin family protein [Pontiellaceae bacterium B1224]
MKRYGEVIGVVCLLMLACEAFSDGYYVDEAAVKLPVERFRHDAALLGDGTVAILGGFAASNRENILLISKDLSSVEKYGDDANLHQDSSGIALPNGNAMVLTGGPGYIFDYKEKRIRLTENSLPVEYARWPTITLLSSGLVFVSGGDSADFQALAYWALYDPELNRFVKTGDMFQRRSKHTATELQDGRVLIAGGSSHKGQDGYRDSAEIFDPKTGKSTLLSAKMLTVRAGHAAVLLDNGKVLLVGSVYGDRQRCELFDPRSKRFIETGSLGQGRSFPVLWKREGEVLVVGGASLSRVIEVYDEEQECFFINHDLLHYPRFSGFSLTPLNSDMALVVGGRADFGDRSWNKLETISARHALDGWKKPPTSKRSSNRNVGAVIRVFQDGELRREIPVKECALVKGDACFHLEKYPLYVLLTDAVADCVSPRLEVAFAKDYSYAERVNLLNTVGFGDIREIRMAPDLSSTEALRWKSVKIDSLLPTAEELASTNSIVAAAKLRYFNTGYEAERDALKDLEAVKDIASQDGLHSLIVVGGRWNMACRKFTDYIEDSPSVSKVLSDRYIILKVIASPEKRNKEFLSEFPKLQGIPHVFILDENGEVKHSFAAKALEANGSYDTKKLLTVLSE